MSRSASKSPKRAPKVGFVSLGCPKALVDSERILTHLRAEGYEVSPTYDAADVVVVNTCGFIDAAVDESLDAIGEALEQNGRVIVTGCLGARPERILERHPRVLKVTGPHAYEDVLNAVHEHLPPQHDPFFDLVPPQGVRLTPRHYAYLKISEGCNNKCSFCIIPDMRVKLASRRIDDVLREGERLVKAGVKELLVISQDTSAYGADIRYAKGTTIKRGEQIALTPDKLPAKEYSTAAQAPDADIMQAVEAAKAADQVVMVLGENDDMSGEYASRASLTLPGKQQLLLESVAATGKPVTLVLVSGRPLDITWASTHVASILEAWFPGTQGGNAVADLLFGDANPGGKLPVTWPRNAGQEPLYYSTTAI